MKKGQIVKCVSKSRGSNYLTIGKEYIVQGGPGDADQACGGRIASKGFTILDDVGDFLYCLDDGDLHGEWEVVA